MDGLLSTGPTLSCFFSHRVYLTSDRANVFANVVFCCFTVCIEKCRKPLKTNSWTKTTSESVFFTHEMYIWDGSVSTVWHLKTNCAYATPLKLLKCETNTKKVLSQTNNCVKWNCVRFCQLYWFQMRLCQQNCCRYEYVSWNCYIWDCVRWDCVRWDCVK